MPARSTSPRADQRRPDRLRRSRRSPSSRSRCCCSCAARRTPPGDCWSPRCGRGALVRVIAVAMGGVRVPVAVIGIAESARLFLWLVFLLSMLRGAGERGTVRRTCFGHDRPRFPLARVANAGLVATVTIAAGAVAIDLFAFGGRAAFIIKVIAAVFALVCLEQVYRNTPHSGRWSLKFLAIALLALFGFDLVMYSEALLFSRMNPVLWTARGYANALLVPLLAIAAVRNRDVEARRQRVAPGGVPLRDAVRRRRVPDPDGRRRLLGAPLRRRVGRGRAGALRVRRAGRARGGARIGPVRARLRVFLAKHFFSYRYDYRSEWLQLTELLAGGPVGATSAPAGATRRSGPPGASGARRRPTQPAAARHSSGRRPARGTRDPGPRRTGRIHRGRALARRRARRLRLRRAPQIPRRHDQPAD